MPPSWNGDMESRTGISYTPRGRVQGREALFMHSPWRVPPGRTWVDYPLTLPATRPIALAFGVALSGEAALPEGLTPRGLIFAPFSNEASAPPPRDERVRTAVQRVLARVK